MAGVKRGSGAARRAAPARERRYWLFKSEPGTYGFEHLQRDGRTAWHGVRNYQARNLLRDEIQVGDGVLFYHSSTDPNVIAFALKGGPQQFAWRALRERAEELEARFGLPFPRYVNALRAMNRCSADALLAAPPAE